MGLGLFTASNIFWLLRLGVMMNYKAFRLRHLSRMEARGEHAKAQALTDACTRQMSRYCMEHFRVRVEVEGVENIPAEGPYLLLSNHQSMYDITAIVGYLPAGLGFLAKRELFRLPGMAFFLRHMVSFPLDRGSAASARETMEQMADTLRKHKRGIVIFPEGTRTKDPDGALGPFKAGSVRLATDAGFPIVPVALDGTRLLTSPRAFGKVAEERRVVRIRVFPPVKAEGLRGKERQAFVQALHAQIQQGREEIKVNWEAGE